MRRKRAAFRKIRAAGARKAATTPASRTSKFLARSSRAALIFARRTTAVAIARPPAIRKRWIPPRATSDFAASSGKAESHEQRDGRDQIGVTVARWPPSTLETMRVQLVTRSMIKMLRLPIRDPRLTRLLFSSHYAWVDRLARRQTGGSPGREQ